MTLTLASCPFAQDLCYSTNVQGDDYGQDFVVMLMTKQLEVSSVLARVFQVPHYGTADINAHTISGLCSKLTQLPLQFEAPGFLAELQRQLFLWRHAPHRQGFRTSRNLSRSQRQKTRHRSGASTTRSGLLRLSGLVKLP